jgi:transcription factor E2F3
VPPPGEYHNFGAPADTGEEVVEAVVLRHRFPFPG